MDIFGSRPEQGDSTENDEQAAQPGTDAEGETPSDDSTAPVVDPDDEALDEPDTPTVRTVNAADEAEDDDGYVGVSSEYRNAGTHHYAPLKGDESSESDDESDDDEN